jgi:hypothetical protein
VADSGTIRRVEQTPTEAGNMRTNDAVTTQHDLSIPSGNVVKTPRYKSEISIYDGSLTAPVALLPEQYGRVSYRKNKFGNFDGEREVTEYFDDIIIPGWSLTESTQYVKHPLRTTIDGKGYIRYIGYVISIIQTNSANEAITHAGTSVSPGLVGTEAGSSRYEALANGQYRAFKITKWDEGTTAWTTDSDGDIP